MNGTGGDWVFGCDSWVFGDGTYTRIEVGHEFVASIEFWPIGRFEAVDPRPLSVEHTTGNRYAVTAQVVEVADFIVIHLDGLDVSCHAPPMSQSAELKAGKFVTGKVGLALNPFDWDPTSHSRRKRWVANAIARRGAKATTEPVTAAPEDTGSLDSFLIQCAMVSTH